MSDLIIIDDFLDASLLNSALEQLEQQGLAQFQNFQLPGLVNNGTGRRAKVQVPGHLVQKLHNALGMEEIGEIGPMAILPAMMSRGDVRSHRDVWNGRIVSSHTVIIWLSGTGSLILTEESALNQHVVDVKPGRLVAFNNSCFHHAVHGDLRAMLGPMAFDGREFRAVMDVNFQGPRTCWEKFCCCCCLVCCCVPCLLMLEGAGSLFFAFLLVLRVILGAFRGAVLAVLLAPALVLCYAGTALCWSPMIFYRACTGLLGDRRCTCILTLLLLPLRVPLVLVMSLACLLPAIFLWIVFATLVYEEDEECKNLLCGGVITVEPFSGVADVLPKMTLDWWRYHATWRPDQELFSRSTRSNQAMTVEPHILGADAEEGRPQNPTAQPSFLDHSETWQYVAGSISTQDVWQISLRRTTALGAELHSKGYITEEDVLALEPYLFVGLPAAAVVRLVLRSMDSEGLDFEEMKMTRANRPHNAFADTIWSLAMKAKRAAKSSKPIGDLETDYLIVMALQRPGETLTSWNIEETRQAELNKIVAAAVELSITASRSRDFKNSIGLVIQGILEPLKASEGGWTEE